MTVRMTEEQYRRLQNGENAEPELGEELAPVHKEFSEAIAIDPGKTTGVAWTDGGEVQVWESDFWGIHDTLRAQSETEARFEDLVVLLEAPYLSRPGMRTGNPAQAYRSGGCGREAELLQERLDELGYEVVEHDPAGQNESWTSKTAQQIIGDWHGDKDNEHVRDALRLLFLYNFI